MQQQPSNSASNRVSIALMAAILCFGIGSAYMVLRKPETTTAPALVSAPAPTMSPVAAPPASTPASPPASVAASAAPAPVAGSAAPASAAGTLAPNALAPALPPATPAAASQAAPSASASALPASSPASSAMPALKAGVAKPVETKSSKQPVPKRTAAEAPLATPNRAKAVDAASPDWKQTKREPVVRVLDQAPEKDASTALPDVDKASERSTPRVSDKPVDKTSADKASAASAPVATAPRAVEAQTTRAVIAEPLVREKEKPTVVMATAQKAWIRIDDKLTIIIHKGEQVQGLGTFQGFDGKAAKFDSGSYPVSSGSN